MCHVKPQSQEITYSGNLGLKTDFFVSLFLKIYLKTFPWLVLAAQKNTKKRQATIQIRPIIAAPDLTDFFGND